MLTKNTKKGFSLVELLVVITIIAILSVVAYTAVGGQTIKARDSKRKQDLNTIQSAMELFFVENGTYPAVLETGTDPGQIPKKFLSEIPVDPSTEQVYLYATNGTTYTLAATLETDGQIPNYKAYIVGNNDAGLIVAGSGGVRNAPDASFCFECATTTPTLGACTPGTVLESGTIAAVPGGPCIPYNPAP